MTLTRREIDALLEAVSLTRDDEVTCGECLKDVAEFAERALAGQSILDSLKAVEHHLAICPECREEYEALLAALSKSTR